MKKELKKRIVTSFFLLSLLLIMFYYTYILILSLIIVAIISWIEFYALISKIIRKNNHKDKVLRFCYKAISLFFLLSLVYLIIFITLENPDLEIIIIYSLLISIMSDVGGLIVGKVFKGKRLTKISPNKTVSGSIGSFLFSLFLIPFFLEYFIIQSIIELTIITILISLSSQIGDLMISLLKRKAKVKNTSDLLPGHGGVLDRIDGMIFSIPFGLILFNFI